MLGMYLRFFVKRYDGLPPLALVIQRDAAQVIVNAAYRTLSDDATRESYDAGPGNAKGLRA